MYGCSTVKYDLISDHLICLKINIANSAEIYHDGYIGKSTGAMAPFQFPTVLGQDVKTD